MATGWAHAVEANRANADGRREDYRWLRAELGLSVRQAAERLGVSVRTAWRYEAARKKGAA
jgi:transposase